MGLEGAVGDRVGCLLGAGVGVGDCWRWCCCHTELVK